VKQYHSYVEALLGHQFCFQFFCWWSARYFKR